MLNRKRNKNEKISSNNVYAETTDLIRSLKAENGIVVDVLVNIFKQLY